MFSPFGNRDGSSPWLGWLGSGIVGAVLGIGASVVYQNVWSKPKVVKRTALKPVRAPQEPAMELLIGRWETTEGSDASNDFRVEYRADATFFVERMDLSHEAHFLGYAVPPVGLTGTYTARRVGNNLKVHHVLAAADDAGQEVTIAPYDKTAMLRFGSGAAEARIYLGRITASPRDAYLGAAPAQRW